MIELPEAAVLASQLNIKITGRKILKVIAAHSPHKFAWYYGDPENYSSLLKGKMIANAVNVGGLVEIRVDGVIIVVGDGVGLRYHDDNKHLPTKHQLLLEFEPSSFLTASVQMYGGILCFKDSEYDNKYYAVAKEKPSPLSKKFNEKYFHSLISNAAMQNKSAKFLLATKQRIPGLGNGVLQDILFTAKIHPRRKIATLSETERHGLYQAVKNVLMEMTEKGGRDTEKDLFGNNGGYITKLSKNTVSQPCCNCGSLIKKENYMGGNIYYCSLCQVLN